MDCALINRRPEARQLARRYHKAWACGRASRTLRPKWGVVFFGADTLRRREVPSESEAGGPPLESRLDYDVR